MHTEQSGTLGVYKKTRTKDVHNNNLRFEK